MYADKNIINNSIHKIIYLSKFRHHFSKEFLNVLQIIPPKRRKKEGRKEKENETFILVLFACTDLALPNILLVPRCRGCRGSSLRCRRSLACDTNLRWSGRIPRQNGSGQT